MSLSRAYDPFGGLLNAEGTASSTYGFAGEEQDEKTGQLYLRARTYSPDTGRFLQQDSVLGQTNQPRTLHRYTYAFNNPVNYTDPAGRMPGNNLPLQPISYNNNGNPSPNFVGGVPTFFPFPDRSVNNSPWLAFSSDAAKLASEGWRPFVCGIGSVLAHHAPSMVREINNSFRDYYHNLNCHKKITLYPRAIAFC